LTFPNLKRIIATTKQFTERGDAGG